MLPFYTVDVHTALSIQYGKCYHGNATTRSIFCCATHVAAENTKHTETFMQSARYCCPILTVSGFSQQIFPQVPNIKFHGNLSTGSRGDAGSLNPQAGLPNPPFKNNNILIFIVQ
jgi:hypothetical protein